ncbi:hypothetical protein C5167_033116 [Papaver somniferum]|uniref:WAT1-related protein n=1 Tax=Papaver somniferum TaxID=3469 RepID=A0A4Y7KB00_PAPSO|nr:hypothetical protein C5167_033116 [Papaver somniferum]
MAGNIAYYLLDKHQRIRHSGIFLLNKRPPLTGWILAQISGCAMLGVVLNQCCFITGVKYTSPTTANAIANLLPLQEQINLGTIHGFLKCVGTLLSIGGAVIIATVRGPMVLTNIGIFWDWKEHSSNVKESAIGPILVLVACLSASAWLNLQAYLRTTFDYPLTTSFLMNIISTIPCATIAVIFEHASGVWGEMGWDICLVLVSLLSVIFANERFYVGGLVGSLVLIGGLILALWAMHREVVVHNTRGSHEPNGTTRARLEGPDDTTMAPPESLDVAIMPRSEGPDVEAGFSADSPEIREIH